MNECKWVADIYYMGAAASAKFYEPLFSFDSMCISVNEIQIDL